MTSQELKDSFLAAADAVASSIPGFNITWNVAKALSGTTLRLRQQRALEWVEMIRDNHEIFTQEMFNTEAFQEGFAYCVERYVVERNEQKRQYVKNIFLGFTASGDYESFPLERLTATLAQLSNKDIDTLQDVDPERRDKNYQVYGSTDNNVDNIFNLIYLGILRQDITARYVQEGFNAPFVNISTFGKEFLVYVLK